MPNVPVLSPGRATRYALVARTLVAAIARGDYAVGSRLPTESDLCRRFDVSRFTVRQALDELRERGLIASRPGVGSTVISRQGGSTYVESFSSIEDMLRYARGSPLRVTSVEDVVADAALAKHLDCRPGKAFLRIRGIRYEGSGRSGTPVAAVEALVDAVYGAIRSRLSELDRSIAGLIEDTYGTVAACVDQEIAAAPVPAECAKALHARAGSPAIELRRWYRDAGGSIFEASRSIIPMGRRVHRSRFVRAGSPG